MLEVLNMTWMNLDLAENDCQIYQQGNQMNKIFQFENLLTAEDFFGQTSKGLFSQIYIENVLIYFFNGVRKI